MSGILTQEWREEHARAGDFALEKAESALNDVGAYNSAQTWALIAQAHYQAANVRARSLAPVYDVSIDGRPLHQAP